MLRATLWGLHAKTSATVPFRSKASLRSLRRQLTDLKSANAAATAWRVERRRLASLLQRHRWEQQQQQQAQGRSSQGSSWGCSSNASSASASSSGMSEAERELHAEAVRLLPRNPELESAIAFTLRENRDARTELEFTRHILNSTLLSLASPVGPWDPYDVKPQVFALDTYLALPVFTSMEYLELFCRHFGFTVRDPSGVLWVDGQAGRGPEGAGAVKAQLTPPDAVSESMWWGKEAGLHSQGVQGLAGGPCEVQDGTDGKEDTARGAGCVRDSPGAVEEPAAAAPLDAAGLFDDLADATPLQDSAPAHPPASTVAAASSATSVKGARRKKKKRRATAMERRRLREGRRRQKTKTRSRAPSSQERLAAEKAHREAAEAEHKKKEAFWRSVAEVSPFRLQQATPLPTFGRFVYPFFIGYFADINTLLHNASIVPEKVDIVLNPLSPTEFVLAREATDRILHRDQLLLLAYQRVERELQREFSTFFARYCPEVQCARSACVPRPLDTRAAAAAVAASRGVSHAANPLQDLRARTRVLRESEFTGGVSYEVAVLIRSSDLGATYRCVQWGKERCLLMGHPDLDLLPEAAAAPHVAEAAQTFYVASAEAREAASPGSGGAAHTASGLHDASAGQSQGDVRLGAFRKLGESQTVSVAQSADSYFHDPTNAYTEAHAVFTEELKVKRGQ